MGKYTENELQPYASTDRKFWPHALEELIEHPEMVKPIIILDNFDPINIKGKLFLSIVNVDTERYLQIETTNNKFSQIFVKAFKDDAIKLQDGIILLPWQLFVK
jgi:hypothetical protein